MGFCIAFLVLFLQLPYVFENPDAKKIGKTAIEKTIVVSITVRNTNIQPIVKKGIEEIKCQNVTMVFACLCKYYQAKDDSDSL